MLPSRRLAPAVLLFAALCAACVASPPPPSPLVVPAALLQPQPEPAAPGDDATDADVASYIVRLVGWGRGLRDQLAAVAVLVARE